MSLFKNPMKISENNTLPLSQLAHLIHDEKVNELFRWRAPIYMENELDLSAHQQEVH